MANQIKSHPDGNIYITNGTKRYIEDAVDFATDMQTLNKPNPQAERTGAWQYDVVDAENGNFSTINGAGEHSPKTAERWLNAEAAIARIDDLLALQQARNAAKQQAAIDAHNANNHVTE